MWTSHLIAVALVAVGHWPRNAFALPALSVDAANGAAIDPSVVSTIYVKACAATSTNIAASSTSTVIGANSPAPTVLQPTAGVNVNTSSHDNLIPNNAANLTYVQVEVDSGNGTNIAVVSIDQMDYAAVNMLHTTSISSLTCTNDTAKITFNSTEAFQVAATNWTSAFPFVMIIYHEQCGEAYANGEHGFVVAESITSTNAGSLTIQLNITHTDFGTAVGTSTNVTVDIGSYAPNQNGSFGTNTTTTTTSPMSGLNSTFDEDLDDSLGPYISLSDTSKWTQLLPNISTSDTGSPSAEGDDFPSLEGRSIHRRGFWSSIGNAFKKAAQTVYKAVVQPVVKWVGNAVDSVEQASLKALNVLDRFLTVDKSLSERVTVNQYPSNADSPWGRAMNIYSNDKVQAYCVGCGVNGQITITGRLTFSVAHGLKEGSIGADGNFHGVLKLGLVANVQYTKTIDDKTLAQVVLSDLVLPGIIQIGPSVALSAGGSLTLAASGQLIAGAVLDWPNIHAKLDVASIGRAEASGFAPNIDPVFSINGQVSATVDVHLRATLGFTIGLLNIKKFTTQLALVEQPGITASATAAGSASLSGAKFDGACAGVLFSANVYNRVYADLFGSEKSIFDWTSPALSKCLQIGPKRSIDGIDMGYHLDSRESRSRSIVVETTRKQPMLKRITDSPSLTNGTATNSTDAAIMDDSASTNATYTEISSLDGLFEIHWSTNGNLYAITSNDTTDSIADGLGGDVQDSEFSSEDITTSFSTFNGTYILGDSDGRSLHGYADELANYNVTRARLHVPSTVPATSLVLAMRRVSNEGGGPHVLGAEDTAGNLYSPIICAYKNLFPKLFFAIDPINGVKTLNNLPELTGPGLVSCGYVPLVMGPVGDLA